MDAALLLHLHVLTIPEPRASSRKIQRANWPGAAPAVRQARLNEPGSDTTVLNASLLVARPTLPAFDKLLESVAQAAGPRLQFDCVGPLPPYSFADLRL